MFVVSTAQANAQSLERLEGAGTHSCAKFTDAFHKSPNMELAYFTWAEGFMAGLNIALNAKGHPSRNTSALSIADQTSRIRKFCEMHPHQGYAAAVQALFSQLPQFSLPNK